MLQINAITPDMVPDLLNMPDLNSKTVMMSAPLFVCIFQTNIANLCCLTYFVQQAQPNLFHYLSCLLSICITRLTTQCCYCLQVG